jgi:hypothetical protein
LRYACIFSLSCKRIIDSPSPDVARTYEAIARAGAIQAELGPYEVSSLAFRLDAVQDWARKEAPEIPTLGISATSLVVRFGVTVDCHTELVPDATHNRPFALNLFDVI